MLAAAFLAILGAFGLIMLGFYTSQIVLSKAALIILVGALLYSPMQNRILKQWRSRKKARDKECKKS